MKLDNRGGWNRHPEEVRQSVLEAVEKGDKTKKQIAEEHGVSASAVYEWTSNKKWREAEARRARYFDQVVEWHWAGWTYHAIARELGIPVQTVWDWINRPPGQGVR